MKRFRVVTDAYAGYEVQVKESWFLPWVQVDCSNTFRSQEEAIYFIKEQKDRDAKIAASGLVVYEE